MKWNIYKALLHILLPPWSPMLPLVRLINNNNTLNCTTIKTYSWSMNCIARWQTVMCWDLHMRTQYTINMIQWSYDIVSCNSEHTQGRIFYFIARGAQFTCSPFPVKKLSTNWCEMKNVYTNREEIFRFINKIQCKTIFFLAPQFSSSPLPAPLTND